MQKQIAIIKSDLHGLRKALTNVATESPCVLTVDGESTCIFCSPNYFEELAVGYLAGRGIITAKEDIAMIASDEHGVTINLKPQKGQAEACAIGIIGKAPFDLEPEQVGKKLAAFNLDIAKIKAVMKEFIKPSLTYLQTRGVHSAAVGCGEKQLFWAEDVARYNAFSKALGYCVLNELNMADKYIMLSGRISGDMVRQAKIVGVKLMVAKGTPLGQAIDLARGFGIGIIGLVKGENCNIYNL